MVCRRACHSAASLRTFRTICVLLYCLLFYCFLWCPLADRAPGRWRTSSLSARGHPPCPLVDTPPVRSRIPPLWPRRGHRTGPAEGIGRGQLAPVRVHVLV